MLDDLISAIYKHLSTNIPSLVFRTYNSTLNGSGRVIIMNDDMDIQDRRQRGTIKIVEYLPLINNPVDGGNGIDSLQHETDLQLIKDAMKLDISIPGGKIPRIELLSESGFYISDDESTSWGMLIYQYVLFLND